MSFSQRVFYSILQHGVINKLPADTQKQIMSVSGLTGSKFWGKNMFDTAAQEVRSIIKDKKYELTEYTLPASEVANFSKVGGEPLWEAWVKAQEGKGSTEARDILNTTKQLLK
jgi:hypothetical protein